MSDPVLEYLKSVKQDIREMRSDLVSMMREHGNRIDNLEDAHAEQRGMVKMAGVLITTVSGIVAFLVSHFKH
jgi:hypothetical protein